MHDQVALVILIVCTLWQSFLSLFSETLIELFVIMLLLSIFESFYYAKPNQSIKGRIRNLTITTLNMAISIFTICVICFFFPLHRPCVVLSGIQSALTVFLFLLTCDYFFYWYHRAQHKFSFLWAIHELHHSDAELNSTSSARTSWPEGLVQRIVITIPTLCLIPLDLKSAILAALLAKLWLVFTHANLRLNLGLLTPLVCGPQLHRIHHSIERKHYNTNFAQYFPIWDVLFSTYYQPQGNEFPDTGIPSLHSNISPLATIGRPIELWSLQLKQLLEKRLKSSNGRIEGNCR